MLYAVTDIETTGGSARSERITEVAVYLFDGKEIVDEFSSLIYPERAIPHFITTLTGITNEMVEDAPPFYQVAKRIVEITGGATFVAHNANFDYSFLREEFKNLGYTFKRKILDTVKLSRKLLPGHRSYSLGSLCSELGIEINGRHRAAGDALATVKLLRLLLEKDAEINEISLLKSPRIINLNPRFPHSQLAKLPEEAGVYYFYNDHKQPIYIGKSLNLKQRVLTHLSNNTSRRAMEMKYAICDIDWECTGNELVALLRESEQIKEHKPLYNRAQRRTSFQYGVYTHTDEKGYIRLQMKMNDCSEEPLLCYSSKSQAHKHLMRLVEEFSLCQKMCGLYQSAGACFQEQIGLCHGACSGKEGPEEYNKRALKALNTFAFNQDNFFIVDKGRNKEERAVVKVVSGKYRGFGFFDTREVGFGLDALHDCIRPAGDNRDIQVILKSYLQGKKGIKIIPF